MTSPQSLTESERRLVAAWAADCAERVLPLYEAESADGLARYAIARARGSNSSRMRISSSCTPPSWAFQSP